MIEKISPLFFLLLAACTAHNATFVPVQPSSEKGSAVYVYRASKVSSLMLPPDINIKDAEGVQTDIGRLNYGEYKLIYLKPGSYDIQVDGIKYYASGEDLLTEVKPQTVNYLRLNATLKFETGLSYKPYGRKYDLQKVDEATALKELASCVDVDNKPKKKNRSAKVESDTVTPGAVTKETSEKEEEAVFSTDKTSDPFSRNR